MTMEVKFRKEPPLAPGLAENDFRNKMIERIKSNFANILDEEDHTFLEMGEVGLDKILNKYFTSNH